MIYEYEDADAEDQEEKTLSGDKEYVHAKAFLQKASTDSGENLYDHLSDVLNKILSERPSNISDFFEEFSRKVKEKRFRSGADHLQSVYVPHNRTEDAEKMMEFLQHAKTLEPPANVDPADLSLADLSESNLLEMLMHLEQAGLGLPKIEMYSLILGIKKLIHSEPIASIRFWGVIHGLYRNYYVVETDLKEEEYMRRNEHIPPDAPTAVEVEVNVSDPKREAILAQLYTMARDKHLGGEESKFPRPLPPMPVNFYVKPPVVPSEPSGVGVNDKVYYVTTDLTGKWEQLPDVTPDQVRVSRLIYKSFTGNLNQEMITYPEFTGQERHYLRAQIARISACTHISPLGYYTFQSSMFGEGFDEEEFGGEEEEQGRGDNFRVNPRYDPLPLTDLLDPALSFWVHHGRFILPQGRTSFWSPDVPEAMGEDYGGDEEVEDEEEAQKKQSAVEPETGPPLLTPISEDAQIESVPAWSVRSSSNILKNFAMAIVRSHFWPGAFCVATQGTKFYNVYFGNGLKFLGGTFSPKPLPPIQQDYPLGPEIMEILDPTGAVEEEWRIAHLPKVIEHIKMPRGEEMSEEEDEEDEEDTSEEDED